MVPALNISKRLNSHAVSHSRVIITAIVVTLSAPSVHAQEPQRVTPDTNLAAVIAAAPSNQVFHLAPGRYYVHDIRPRDGQVIEGSPGSILLGTQPVTGFTPLGKYWRAAGPPPLALSHGSCDLNVWQDTPDGCRFRESLFVRGKPIARSFVREQLSQETQSWYQDRKTGEIWINFDPDKAHIEISLHSFAFTGDAKNVVLRGMVIEGYATLAQQGAIQADRSTNWLITKNLIRYNSGAGVRIGERMQLNENVVTSNGQIGITGIGDDVTVINNEITANNTRAFDPSWEAGGTKFVKTQRLRIIQNCLHDNEGPGIWTDIDNVDSVIEENASFLNSGAGIFHEISGSALITKNFSALNGWRENSAWGSQILISGSIDTNVTKNIVEVAEKYGHGIFVIQEGRPNPSQIIHQQSTYLSYGNVISENVIRFFGNTGHYGFSTHGDFQSVLNAENRFEDNVILSSNLVEHFVDQKPPTKSDDNVASQDKPLTTAPREAFLKPSIAVSLPASFADICRPRIPQNF